MTSWNLCNLSKGRQFAGKKCCLPGDSLQVRQTRLKIWQGGKTSCQRPCRKGGSLSLHISSQDCRRCWAPVTWIHLTLKTTLSQICFFKMRLFVVVFLNHTSEQHAFEKRELGPLSALSCQGKYLVAHRGSPRASQHTTSIFFELTIML